LTWFRLGGIMDLLSTIATRIRLIVLLAMVELLGGFWFILL